MSLTRLGGVMPTGDAPEPSELLDFTDWLLKFSPPGSPVQAPVVSKIPQPPVVEISTSPNTSPPGPIPVVGRKQAPVVAIREPPVVEISSSSEGSIPVDAIREPPIVEISSSSSASEGSIPVVAIPQPPVVEISTSPSTSRGSTPVVGRKGAKRKRPPKQVHYVEVTVVEPPALVLSNADEFVARTEWREQVANILPDNLLVAAPRSRPAWRSLTMQQKYNPCSSWEEFIERTREEELSKADSRLKRFKRSTKVLEEAPPVPVGSAHDAIVEIYGERLDAAAFGKYSLFDNSEVLWFHN